MPYTTDQELKSHLDSNQLARERMCRAILALDKRFSDVRPRHPHGGPDGGSDIDAIFKGEQKAAGAVGFVIGANDSQEQKRAIKKKFREDANAAIKNQPPPTVFVFFTNVKLTVAEQKALKAKAAEIGFAETDIFDRERMRVSLDTVDGFAARFQYLDIALSDAEQASFFARWGDDIQSVIATGFQRVERTLDRLLFLQEANDILSRLTLIFELDRTYQADEIGHFRAFCDLFLVEEKHGIASLFFGSADRGDDDSGKRGIKHGIRNGQWEASRLSSRKKKAKNDRNSCNDQSEKWEGRFSGSSIGVETAKFIYVTYHHDGGFLRFQPRLSLCDLDGATYLPYLNASLATKVKTIHVVANGYKLAEINSEGMEIDAGEFAIEIPAAFTAAELNDPWVRIRGARTSAFTLDFSSWTPRRHFVSRDVPDLPKF
jgi:hypothetical protein